MKKNIKNKMNSNRRKQIWLASFQDFNVDESQLLEVFFIVEKAYQESHRAYHNTIHINELLGFYLHFEKHITNKPVVIWSIFFHDYIYEIGNHNNEEDSAKQAVVFLKEIGISTDLITLCSDYILATKTHLNINNDKDLDYFLDFDMAILGADPEKYDQYRKQIRMEFCIFPDQIYNQGRTKILNNFLNSDSIYKTAFFKKHYHLKSIINIKNEILLLTQ